MKKLLLMAVAAGMVLIPRARSDVLELKDGSVLNGKYTGGTAGTVRFDSSAGSQVIEVSKITALTFTMSAGATPATAAPAAAPPAPAPAAAQAVTIPAGTTLLVRTMDSVSSRDKAGAVFTTKLESDVGDGGAIKTGTIVYGKVQSSTQAGRAIGQSTLDLRLSQIVVNGKTVPIITSGYQNAGQRSIAKAAKGAAAGAAIGAIAGDAGKGAAIGAVGGAVLRGQTITVPPGTVLEFTLMQPVTIPAS